MTQEETPTPPPADPAKPTLPTARAKPTPSKDHLQPAWLDVYKRTENQTLANKEVGVGHDVVTRWKKSAAFMKLFTAAHLEAQKKNNDNLKASALQRAINGNPHPIVKNGAIVRDAEGQPVIAYREFETQLTLFMMKNRMPDEFKDKFEHEITGQVLVTLTSEVFGIIRRNVPEQYLPAIQKELESLSAKMASR